MEKISVIVPVYNVEEYLYRCVDSIRNQSYKNLEIILVDDGSPDRCPQMCDVLKEKDDRIKLIHKQNEGLGLTRNAGLAIATGELVTFVDSDDWIGADHIENLYRELKKTGADVVMGKHTRVTSDGVMTKKGFSLANESYEGAQIIEDIVLPLIGPKPEDFRDVQISSSVAMNLYSMRIIRENDISFVSERYAVAEDTFFNIDFFVHANRVVCMDEYGYYYWQNVNSISEKYNPKRFERTLNYGMEARKRAEKYGLLHRAEHRIERSFLMKVRIAIRHVVMADLKKSEKYSQIRCMLTDPLVKSALQNYPINAYGFSMRLLLKCMKKGCVKTVYMLTWMREAGRNNGFMRKILYILGLGR